jgi:hypothetical protein
MGPARDALWDRLKAVVVGLLLLAVACSASDSTKESTAATEVRDGGFEPIEGMEATTGREPLSPEDTLVIYGAEERLAAGCMAEAGFEYDLASSGSVAPAPLYLSPSALRETGYGYDWTCRAASSVDMETRLRSSSNASMTCGSLSSSLVERTDRVAPARRAPSDTNDGAGVGSTTRTSMLSEASVKPSPIR